MKIIKINYLTYYFLILYFLCGLIKTGIIIFIIVFIHEMGHVFFAKIFKYEVKSITIYPFGGITSLSKDINSPVVKDFFLSIGGFVFQALLLIVFVLLNKNSLITNKTFDEFVLYNNYILLFNLLPIIPLDGSYILECITSKLFSYKVSMNINIYTSCVFAFIFIIYNYTYSLNNYVIVSLFIFKIFEYIKTKNSMYNKFLLERYINNYEFKKIKTNKKNNINNMKKGVGYYFWKNFFWEDEKSALKNKYAK